MDDKTIIIKTEPAEMSDKKKDVLSGIVNFFHLCIDNWKLFLSVLVASLALAFLYLQTEPYLYTRSASVHIKDGNRGSTIGSISEEFSNLGFGNTASSVNNEVVAFNSPQLAEQVVKQLNLQFEYRVRYGLRKQKVFGDDLPINVSFPNVPDYDALDVKLTLLPSGKVRIGNLKYKDKNEAFQDEVSLGDTVKTIAGDVIFLKTSSYSTPSEPLHVFIHKYSVISATYSLHKKIKAFQNSAKNSVIDILYTDESIEMAEAVINTLISEYNKNWLNDKNALGVLTTQFIDERIAAIRQELGGVDSDIASYKASNLINNPIETASLLMSQANASDQQAIKLNNQIQMCQYLYEFISKDSREMIPANVGIQSESINNQVLAYNQKLLLRNTYANNSSDSNPLVHNLDEELAAQRNTILQSLLNEKASLDGQLMSSRKTVSQSTARLSSSPVKEKELLSMDRQQKVKEALYLFLLQKREENELSQAFTAYNTRVICRPMGLNTPTSPMPLRIYFVAVAIALLLPMVLLYLRELLKTKVEGRKDIDTLSAPFIGEISQKEENRKSVFRKGKKEYSLDVVVRHDSRDLINEGFRMVRTNLNYLLNSNSTEKRKVVLVTSALPSSGKSFITINLALALSFHKDIKVAVMDLDIRKASLSQLVGKPKKGLTDYLGGFLDDWHSLALPYGSESGINDASSPYNSITLLPAGHIPPNPTELLQSDRMQRLLEEMKLEYDIILLDTPPVEVVADVNIVKRLADLTVFVIRAGMMNRSMLPVIERYYKDKTFNNLSILLNGVKPHHNHYGYGYGYGY